VNSFVQYEAAISLNSKRFTLPGHSEYNIIMSLGRNYLELAICNLQYNSVLGMQYYYTGSKVMGKKQAVAIFTSELVQGAQKLTIAVDSPKSTLIPESLLDTKQTAKVLASQHIIDENELVFTDKIESFYNLYTLKSGTKKLIEERLPSAKIINSTKGLLSVYPILATAKNQIFIFCRDDYIYLSSYVDSKLQLHQYHSISAAEDAVYHTLNLIQTNSFKLQETVVMLHGESLLTKQIHDQLDKQEVDTRYISRLRLSGLQFSEQILELPTHQFFNLFSLVSCESLAEASAVDA